MQMPGRTYTSGNQYRYGFSGREKDNEIKGEGNSLDFGARIYDSRLGRFLSIDPYSDKFPFNSPYAYAANSPIANIDKDGKFPVFTHYQLTYEALIKAKIDKVTASEIAHYASTYADNPSSGILKLNKAIAVNYLYKPSRLDYDEEKYGPYDKTYSQSDNLVVAVSIHAMRTYWEDITPDEAVKRALYGGVYKEKDGTEVRIIGAYEVVNSFKGKDISKLTKEEKKLLGVALHTIQDAEIHKGGRWVDEHKKEAKKMGKKNEHPTTHECLTPFGAGNETEKAAEKTDEAVKIITTTTN